MTENSQIAVKDATQNKHEKPALVFVHGYLGGSSQWQDQVDFFSKYFEVITPCLPGYDVNHQLKSPESIEAYAQYVLDELEKRGIDGFYLVGHSMGGMIVQNISVRVPKRVKKLVLYGTGPIGKIPGRFESIDTSKQRLKDEGLETSARRISSKWFVGGIEGQGYQACADIAVKASLQAATAGLTAMQMWDGKDALKSIESPTLVLWGDQDKSYSWPLVDELWNKIPESSLSVIAGCSHAVHLEKPDLFNVTLLDYLQA